MRVRNDLARQLQAQATVIGVLLRRLDLTETVIDASEMDLAEGEIALDVERDHRGDLVRLHLRFTPDSSKEHSR